MSLKGITLARVDPAELATWNAAIARSRHAYHEHPATTWCYWDDCTTPAHEGNNWCPDHGGAIARTPRKATRPPAKCGTPSGFKRHRKHGEQPCGECRAAKRKYDRDRYQRTKT